MIQRLGCLVASILFAFVGATAFAETQWFDGQISETPALTAGSGGSWDIPASGGWDSANKTYNNFTTPLKFTATESKSNIASITTSVKFTAKDELTEEEIVGAKGGLAVLEAEDGSETNYWGVVSGAWVKLAGAEPDLTQTVEASISLFTVGKDANKKTYINYTIGSTPLTVGGNADILTDVADASIQSVEYLGKCELASLSGATEAPYVAQDGDGNLYKTIAEAGDTQVTIVNELASYTPVIAAADAQVGGVVAQDPYGFLGTVNNSETLANVGLKVAKVGNDVVIRPNFTSNNGDGTSAATAWEIGSEADLNALRLGIDNGKLGLASQYFKQTKDIELTAPWEGLGVVQKQMGKDCKELVTDVKAFRGVYDGGGQKVTNVTFPNDKTYRGFFNTLLDTAAVSNLTVECAGFVDATTPSTDYGAGIIVGSVLGAVTIENCTAKGTLSTHHNAAGIAAKLTCMTNYNKQVFRPTIKNCRNEATLTNDLSENPKAGGIVCLCEGGDVIGCVNTGNVQVNYKKVSSSSGGAVGGLVAYSQTQKLTISGGSNTGAITVGEKEITEGTTYNTFCGSIVGNVNVNTEISDGVTSTANIVSIGNNAGKATGFKFATINGEVATAVTTPVKNNSYKVMAAVSAPAAEIALSQGDTIAFDNALYTTFDATAKIVAAVPASTKITPATSGTVTTFTCVEKASATVSITMTGATATVSVADGASVYEGTTITVTGEAATEGYEAPITVKINGVDQKSYTTTASDTSIDIVITATSKIVPIDPSQDPELPKMDVNKEKFPGKTTEQIKTYLKTEQANGQKGWVNYALGIGDTAADKPFLADKGTAGKVVIDLGNAGTAPTDSGITSKIVKVVEGGEDVELVNGEIALSDTTETAVFTVALVLYDKEGNPETVVEKDVGIEKKAVASEMEILSVPFTDMNSAEQISVDKLIKTMNLADGDRLMVYNGTKGVNEGWTFSEGAWTPDSGVGAAAETFVKPGDGLWFQRAIPPETATPIFKFGAFSATKAKTVAPADGWKLVANPNLTGEVNLNNGFVENPAVADEIQVETATVPTIYTYDGENWGFDEMQVTGTSKTGRKITKKVRNTTDTKIAPGAGFWFGNSGSASKNLDWSK